jgi:hypothetical protein
VAVRRRFKPTEREAFVPKTEVEWLHGSHWRPGVIVGPIEVGTITGRQYVGLINKGATRTIRDGQYLTGRPGGVRLRDNHAAPAADGSTAPDTMPARQNIETTLEQAELF